MRVRLKLSATFLWWLTAVAGGHAQDSNGSRVLVTEHPTDKRVLPCPAGTKFEGIYEIKNVTVDDPFKFLYLIGHKRSSVEAQLKEKLTGQIFSRQLVEQDAFKLIEDAQFTPDIPGSFVIKVEILSVTNCDPAAKTLDVIYRIYSTAPPRNLAGAAETQAIVEKAPQTAVGLDQTGKPFHLTPVAGYNRSYDVFGGGRVRYVVPRSTGPHFVDAVTVDGQGSASMREVSGAVHGSRSFQEWVNHAEWLVNYTNHSVPAGMTRLGQSTLSGQVDAQSRTFLNETVFARFGSQLQGGNMQSAPLPAGSLPPKTVANAGYGSLRSYLGLSSRSSHNVMSVSYGLELGSIGPYSQLGWVKQIGDVADEWWTSIGDHKPLEVETRVTFGAIQVSHAVPLGARFFAGNADHFFIPGDAWQIRDVPVIRAIPANRFYLTSQGVGGDRFAGINLTFSYPVKSYPLIPKELSTDKEFNQILKGQIDSAAAVEQTYYAWKDEHFAVARSKIPELQQQLATLQKAVEAARTGKSEGMQNDFDNCSDNVTMAVFYARKAVEDKGSAQYGELQALVTGGAAGDALGQIQQACVAGLNQQLNDGGIRSAAEAVDSSRTAILDEYNAIDQGAATRKAAGDIAFVNRTLNTLFKDFNIFSIAPLGVFDSAWIGPSKRGLGGNRIGPGGGLRVELASSATFTLGYAWNVNRMPGEGAGALFFSLGVRDLFH
jgi:hypothetical protein